MAMQKKMTEKFNFQTIDAVFEIALEFMLFKVTETGY